MNIFKRQHNNTENNINTIDQQKEFKPTYGYMIDKLEHIESEVNTQLWLESCFIEDELKKAGLRTMLDADYKKLEELKKEVEKVFGNMKEHLAAEFDKAAE